MINGDVHCAINVAALVFGRRPDIHKQRTSFDEALDLNRVCEVCSRFKTHESKARDEEERNE